MKNLDSKLKQYSALSAGILIAGAKVGKTQILYTDLNPDVVVSSNGQIAIDLDQDAIDDLTLEQYYFSYTYYYNGTYYTYYYNSVQATNHPDADVMQFGTSTFRADRLDFNEPIGSAQTFATSTNVTLGSNGSSSYDWNAAATDKYLGVRVRKGTNFLYGWIRLDYDNGSSGFTVKDFAIQTTPNQSITAGDSINPVATINDTTLSVNEGITSASTVGILEAQGTNLSFSILSGNSGNVFNLNSGTGRIIVLDSAAINFEVNPSFLLEVEVDDGSVKDTALVTINVNDINEIPVITPSQSFTIPENSANGTLVGTVMAVDEEGGISSFNILSGNTDDAFAIDNTGRLTVDDESAINFETNPTFDLRISVSDGVNQVEDTVRVNITDVVEVGIEEISDVELSVFPNPVALGENFTIQLPNNEATRVTLLTAEGKEVKSFVSNSKRFGIGTTELSKGLYFIKVENVNSQKVGIRRIIVR